MKSLCVGMGEVGKAHYNILSKVYEVHAWDLQGDYFYPPPSLGIEILHICIRYGKDFDAIVRDYMGQYQPKVVNVCTTVPPGTCEKLGPNVVHSTTRGLHPNLETGLLNITKHVGGPLSETVAEYFTKAGIECYAHKTAKTTELAHILNNLSYFASLMFADEMARICRAFGTDYWETVMLYTKTHNEGYAKLDHSSKMRMILTPPNGSVGGHCLRQNAEMLNPILEAAGVDAPLVARMARFGDLLQ